MKYTRVTKRRGVSGDYDVYGVPEGQKANRLISSGLSEDEADELVEKLTESKNIVLNIILEAALRQARNKMRRGTDRIQAIKEVSDEMELTDQEKNDLEAVATAEEPLIPKAKDVEPESFSMSFPDPESTERAIGMLMFGNLPWKSRGSTYIEFPTLEELEEAREYLSKKWNFLKKNVPTVASIEFETLDDYQDVLNFLSKKKNTLELPIDHKDMNGNGMIFAIGKNEEVTPSTKIVVRKII